MTIRGLLRSSGLAALATAMAVTAIPAEAFAKDTDTRGNWSRGPGDRNSSDRGSRGSQARAAEVRNSPAVRRDSGNDRRNAEARPSPQDRPAPQDRRNAERPAPRRVDARQEQRQAPQSGSRPAAVQRPAPQSRSYRQNDGNRGPATTTPGSVRNNAGRPQGSQDRVQDNDRFRDNDRSRDNSRTNWRGSGQDRLDPRRDNTRSRDNDRNSSYRDGNRNGSYRDGNRNGSYSGRDRDHRNWDRKWRSDRRYDWRDYRTSHRHIYRVGRYYAPYRNYYYRPLSIGIFLDSLFYSNRYLISDPYYYRLPPAYGSYRWVRYYDDALLVDIYSGEVVDVIHGFFW
ncbi:MAG TPA: RcnB family protein [Sphingomonadaceae bacterium]|nr:RcnB family protein [Sphingomonadaceae bacterium]